MLSVLIGYDIPGLVEDRHTSDCQYNLEILKLVNSFSLIATKLILGSRVIVAGVSLR